jgi:hypothetical protein
VAIAHDTETRFPTTDGTVGTNSVDTTTGDRSFNHAGSASTKGVVVCVFCTGTTAVVTGVTYGGTSMTLTASTTDTTEAGRVEIYTLTGSSVPTGTQSVVLQGATATQKWACCSTVTASNPVVVNTSNTVGTTVAANPTVALTTTLWDAMAYAASHAGNAAPATTGIAGCTIQKSNDYGALCSNAARWSSVTAAGTTNIGVTLGSDDHCIAAVALSELASVAFPTTGVLDDFNRADGAVGSNWTADPNGSSWPTFNVSSNTLAGTGADSWMTWNVADYGPDCEAYATVTTAPGAGKTFELDIGVLNSGSASIDGYAVDWKIDTNSFRIFRMDNGVYTQLSIFTSAIDVNDKAGFERDGSTLTVYKYVHGMWALAGASTSDATYSSAGKLQIAISDTVGRLDDFGGGTTVVASVTLRMLASTGVGK